MHTRVDPGLRIQIFKGEGGGGGQVFPGDGVPTVHSYRNPLSLMIFQGGGGGFRTPPPLWLRSCIPKDGVGLSSRSLNKSST